MVGGKGTRGYRCWDPASEEALKAGVRKHGLGAWEHIRKDPQFAILSDRSGVQLKDKWRNLVKFRHIDPEEQRTYKPKTQGPWSKKYQRERSQGLSGSESPPSGGEGPGGASEAEEPGPLAVALPSTALALYNGAGEQQQQQQQQERHSQRHNALKRKALTDLALLMGGDGPDPDGDGGSDEYDEIDDDGGGSGGEGGRRRGKARAARLMGRAGPGAGAGRYRKPHEDRRYGIYDRRRYGHNERGGPGRAGTGSEDERLGGSDMEGGVPVGPGGHPFVQHGPGGSGRPVRRAVRRRVGRMQSDGEDDEDADADVEGGDSSGGDDADGAPQSDYVIACRCGVTHDDGQMMIECETCSAWAHVHCLRQHMQDEPGVSYNFDTYNCLQCQQALARAGGLGPGALPASAAAAGLLHAGPRNQHAGGYGPGAPRNGSGPRRRGGLTHGSAGHREAQQAADGGRQEDSGSEDSQQRIGNILLGLANGSLRSGGAEGGGGADGRNGRNGSAAGSGGRRGAAAGGAGHAGGGQAGGLNGGLGYAGSGDLAFGSSARAAAGMFRAGSAPLRAPGAPATSSAGSRGRVTVDGTSPAALDASAGLPLFHSSSSLGTGGVGVGGGGGAGGLGGGKVFRPIPKLATAAGADLGSSLGSAQPQQLSAPKARPHPALQKGASQQNIQRMLEAAGANQPGGGGGATDAVPAAAGSGAAMAAMLDAAGPLSVAAANLNLRAGAGSRGPKPGGDGAAAGSAITAAAAAAGDLAPPRPVSSMAREVANRIFGESDDEDLMTALHTRPLSALRGVDTWFLHPAAVGGLSRAATPSTLFELPRHTPDAFASMLGPSPPASLVAAAAAARSISPGGAFLPALALAQQHQQHLAQQHAVLHHLLAQGSVQAGVPGGVPGAPSSSPGLPGAQPPGAAVAGAAAAAAAATAGAAVPLAPLVAAGGILRPTPIIAPPAPPHAFIPQPLPVAPGLGPASLSLPIATGPPPGWAPPVPPPLQPATSAPGGEGGRPVELHPLLRQILAQQQQPQGGQGEGVKDPGLAASNGDMSGAGAGASVGASGGGEPQGAPGVAGAAGPQAASTGEGGSAGVDGVAGTSGRTTPGSVPGSLGGGVEGAAAPDPAAAPGMAGAGGVAAAALGSGVGGSMADGGTGSGAAGGDGGAAVAAAPPPALGPVALPAPLPLPVAPEHSVGSGATASALLGISGLHPLLEQLRSNSPNPFDGLFPRAVTPGPDALLALLNPASQFGALADMGALSWLKSTTPPLGGVADLLAQPTGSTGSSSGANGAAAAALAAAAISRPPSAFGSGLRPQPGSAGGVGAADDPFGLAASHPGLHHYFNADAFLTAAHQQAAAVAALAQQAAAQQQQAAAAVTAAATATALAAAGASLAADALPDAAAMKPEAALT